MENKKSVSPVIATILLVLITVVAVSLVWAFIRPMIKGSLEESASCFELRDYAKVVESEVYTCSDTPSGKTNIMIERGMENFTIKGFKISIVTGAESEVYDLTDNTDGGEKVRMYDSSTIIKLPQAGGSKTYVFNVAGERADLAIITTAKKVCKVDSYNIPEC